MDSPLAEEDVEVDVAVVADAEEEEDMVEAGEEEDMVEVGEEEDMAKDRSTGEEDAVAVDTTVKTVVVVEVEALTDLKVEAAEEEVFKMVAAVAVDTKADLKVMNGNEVWRDQLNNQAISTCR